MANGGPRTKQEALRLVASRVADGLEQDSLAEDLLPGVRMSPAQRDRVEDAVTEIARRLRLIGVSRTDPGEGS